MSLIRINVNLTIVTIIILLLYLIIIKVFNPYLYNHVIDLQEQNSIINANLVESLESVESIKGQNLENDFYNRFNDNYNIYINKTYNFLNMFNFENFLKNSIDSIGLIMIIFFGSILVLKNKMTVGELVDFGTEMGIYLLNLDIILYPCEYTIY